ncbi:gamma-glutamyltransferase family protein [Candidatus Ichthyocystis hellenicum]|uniref:gamma-glutamyltransferase family protein n=1 Tax=Candidatus Ichthyocystis hellenicum TaxID=1561003 RepID=UPI000B0ADC52|nr:gamma-glutamyltransferase family protein [Candidatus Ichthyocystis hellenicum]
MMLFRFFPLFLVSFFVFHEACADIPRIPEVSSGFNLKKEAYSKKGMVVTANSLATSTAKAILNSGGSAVDAAIAAELVLNLVEPQASGIGGGGFMTIYDPKTKKITSINGREIAPSSFDVKRWKDNKGRWYSFDHLILFADGVGVPGELAMLYRAHKKFGKLPWARLFQPAISLARGGYPVAHRLAAQLEEETMLWNDPEASKLYRPGGKIVKEGAILRNHALADVFEDIAKNGIVNFYQGRWAKDIVEAVNSRAKGKMISLQDLKNYRTSESPALCGKYRDWTVCSSRLPSSGASAILAWLGLIEKSPFYHLQPNSPLAWHWFIESGRATYVDRNSYAGDPKFDKDLTSVLLSNKYQLARLKDLSGRKATTDLKPGIIHGMENVKDVSLERPSTSHVSVVDSSGQAVSLTNSIEDAFGSRLMVDGFLLNNQLLDFSRPLPNEKVVNLPRPGKQPRSAMSPTMVFDKSGKLVLILGSPGGSAIVAYIVGYLVRCLDWQEDPVKNISEPHIFSRGVETEVEDGLVSPELVRQLSLLGHKVVMVAQPSGLSVIERKGDYWVGIADPRRDGDAAGI